jgi:hypothetical protein
MLSCTPQLSDTDTAFVLQNILINEYGDSARLRPNTAFLTRFVGSIERSNLRHLPRANVDEDGNECEEISDIEMFRAEGRQKMQQLANYYGINLTLPYYSIPFPAALSYLIGFIIMYAM